MQKIVERSCSMSSVDQVEISVTCINQVNPLMAIAEKLLFHFVWQAFVDYPTTNQIPEDDLYLSLWSKIGNDLYVLNSNQTIFPEDRNIDTASCVAS